MTFVECPDQPQSWHYHLKSNGRPSSRIRRVDHPQWSSSRSLRSTFHSRKRVKNFDCFGGSQDFCPLQKSFKVPAKILDLFLNPLVKKGKPWWVQYLNLSVGNKFENFKMIKFSESMIWKCNSDRPHLTGMVILH